MSSKKFEKYDYLRGQKPSAVSIANASAADD